MARTISPDFDEKRVTIIECASALFAKRGFLGTSIADVAEACGMSKSLIYHYYRSKEDILFEAMSSHLEELVSKAEEVNNASGAPDTKIRQIAVSFMGIYVGAAARHKVLLNDLEALPAKRRQKIVQRQRDLMVIIEKLFVEIWPEIAEKKGVLRAKTMLFFGMINWTHTWFDPKGAISADGIANMACDHILAVRD